MIALSSLSSRVPAARALALGVIAALLVGGSQATASASPLPASVPTASTVTVAADATDAPTMGDYSVKSFAAEAKTLPDDLLTALDRDSDLTGAEYLAGAAAATDATSVLESLAADGIDITGSHLDGTELVVNVDSEADVAAVEAAGATADLSAPVVPDFGDIDAKFVTDSASDHELSGGEAYLDRKVGFRCSLAFNGRALSNGKVQTLTAGHCKEAKTTEYWFLAQSAAGENFGYVRKLGVPVKDTFRNSGGYDAGLIAITNSYYTATPTVTAWNGGYNQADGTLPVYDRTPAVQGAAICKSGATTGWTCGQVLATDYAVSVEGSVVNSIVTNVCTKGGDSGGAALTGNSAVGVVSWGTVENDAVCTEDDIAGFFPLISNNSSKATVTKRFGKIWEPSVEVGAVSVSSPTTGATVDYAATVSGSLERGNTRNSVAIYVDGKLTSLKAKVTSGGTWSTKLIGVAAGTHTVQARPYWGKYSRSAASPAITVNVTKPAIVQAMSAPNKYTASVEISKQSFPSTATYAFITTGSSGSVVYAAAAAAQKRGAPVLFVPKNTIPSVISKELKRLGVSRIYLVGGSSVLTPAALKSLKKNGTVTAITTAKLNAYTLG